MNINKTAWTILATSAIIAAAVPPAAATNTPQNTNTVNWETCSEKMQEKTGVKNLQCTNITVPLDYRKPAGEKISIHLSKKPAEDLENYQGAMFVNPGGPGASGADSVNMSLNISSEQLKRYDIIGMDLRGTWESKPSLHCTNQKFLTYKNPYSLKKTS